MAILCSLFMPSTGWVRKVENWPYEQLFKEADLVMIGIVDIYVVSTGSS